MEADAVDVCVAALEGIVWKSGPDVGGEVVGVLVDIWNRAEFCAVGGGGGCFAIPDAAGSNNGEP